ncbi:sensor histidine kinase [Actinomycetospora rhizophila]|uniref:histidine kinase n=1 Tax=Actinomycetospora rhizophila TaxID=1416876 RepID=A0ABV9ZDU4_9PSEU
MGPVPGRLLAGLVAGGLVLAGSLVEAATYRGVAPQVLVLPIALLVLGAALAPLAPAVGVLAAALTFPVQVLLAARTPGIGGTALIAMMALVGWGALRMRPRWSAPGAVLAALGGSGGLVAHGESVFEFGFFAVTMGGAWLVGWLLRREGRRRRELRELAAALAAERERSGRLAVVEERARISRELHDAVAHTVSVMTLQVGVLRRRLQETPEGDVLRSVEELGRRSVDELRRVVGALREDADDAAGRDPAPSLARLDGLVAELGRVGLAVTVRHDGEPAPLAPAMDTSAYRIVAEALTNVLRHAGTAEAEVVLTHRRESLAIVVQDRGTGPGTAPADVHGGHGLLHMRERAALFGGTLDAGPREGGGYRVEAVLPLAPAPVVTA